MGKNWLSTHTADTAKMMSLDRFLEPTNRRYGTYRGLIRLALARGEHAAGRLRRYAGPDLAGAERLVFACQGNICRSCFADYAARARGLSSASFGLSTTTGAPANPDAVATAIKHRIDLVPHRVTDISDFEFRDGDLILAMEVRQVRALELLLPSGKLQLALLGLWATPRRPHIHDPFSLSNEYFDTCFTVIESAIDNLAADLQRAKQNDLR